VNRIADIDFQVLAFARDPDVSVSQFAQQVQRRTRLLAQRQSQRILLAALAKRLFLVTRHAEKSVRRTSAVDALVWTLMPII